MFRRSSLWFYVPPPLIVAVLIGLWQYRRHQDGVPADVPSPDPGESIAPRDNPSPPPPAHQPATDKPAPPDPAPRPAPEPAQAAATRDLTLDEAGALLPELVARMLPADRIAGWLQQSNLLVRIVSAVDCIATGASPRDHLGFLAPSDPFRASRAGDGHWYAAAASALRTKATVETFCLTDAAAAAAAFARLEPALDRIYRDLGYPDGRFRDAVARACQVLLDTPVPNAAPPLVRTGTVYRFADPALEALKPAQKHLLRLGVEDARRVQRKVWQLAEALGLTSRQ